MEIERTASASALASALEPAGFEPRVVSSDGGKLVLTVRGARVLGVFLDGVAENLLWTNPAATSDAARAAGFREAGEWNIGGDRCWLSPELELHFRNPRRPSHEDYCVPADIDPGRYELVEESPQGLTLRCRGRVGNLASGSEFEFEMRRSIRTCPPPVDPAGLSYVAYELSSELRIISVDRDEAAYGLWQLMQLPPGGTVYVPVRERPEMLDYFQTGVAEHCRVSNSCVAFPVTGTRKHKLGLRAADVTGLMAYLRPLGAATAGLIVRQAEVSADVTYADYPADQPHRRDVALQFYNDSGQIGGFGEMEYHSPAACRANRFRVEDRSRTWCFGGQTDAVRAVARDLLRTAEIE